MSEHKTNEKRLNVTIYWDDPHIEAEMQLFPPELAPLYRDAKIFVRDECKRDVDAWVERARLQKVTIDKTNWVRIFKGRWKQDADGNELPSPYVSEANLKNAFIAIRDQIRVELLQGGMPFVETTTFKFLEKCIRRVMRKDRVNKFLVIVGPTGTQKTASYKEIVTRNPLVKWMESTDNGSLKEFIIRFAVKCGASRSISYGPARAKIFESMMPLNGQPKAIIIDNMQDMVKSERKLQAMGKSIETQPAYQFLRSLQDETGCAIIWSITPENENQMFNAESIYLEQFEGRAGGRDGFKRLPNYPPIADLVLIAETIGFKTAKKHEDLLKSIGHSRGRIRRFFEILQDAKNAADDDGSPLTAEYIQSALDERELPEMAKKEVKA
jgi:DNA transposition AAA+ family ATPase